MDPLKSVLSGSLPFRPAKSVSFRESDKISQSPSAIEIKKTDAGEIPQSQSSRKTLNAIDIEQLPAHQRTTIMDTNKLPDLIDRNGNVFQDGDPQVIERPLISSDKLAWASIIGEQPTSTEQDDSSDLQCSNKESDNAKTTNDTDDILDMESLPYGVKPIPDEERALANVELDVGVAKKKKNKRRPKTKRGIDAPTGFERFFADAPLTPDEFQEIKKIYDPALPFHMRYDEAIKRFLYKRRLEPRRRHLFLKYLQYGGVNTNQKYGQGASQELKEMTKDEGMEARNFTRVSPEWATKENIAFDTVLKGYLGGYYIDYFSPDDEEEIKIVTGTIKNFLTFLLYHDVCPEYQDDIQKARQTCDLAAKELWKVRQVVHNGPGNFNMACSMLFGGNFFDAIDDPEVWETVKFAEQDRMTQGSARWVLKYAMAGVGPDERAIKFKELAEKEQFKIKQIEDIDGFEIVSIEEPSPLTVGFYKEFAPNLKPVGVARAKEFRDPAKGEFNLSKLEAEKWKRGQAPSYEFEFFLEIDLLAHCFPGMKALTKVFELNCGIHFFDEIMVCLPSFYVFLANDLMINYKGPKTKEPTDRWINTRAEHRKAMDLLAGPKLSAREQARVLLKDLTLGADYDAEFGTRKHVPAATELGFEFDVALQPDVRAEDEMGILVPRYEGQKMKEEDPTEEDDVEMSGVIQGGSTNLEEPKEWWTPGQWWSGQEWYSLVKDWKPTITTPEERPSKRSRSSNGCFPFDKEEDSFDQLKETIRVNGELIKRMEAEMKEATLIEKETELFSTWLGFAKTRQTKDILHIMELQGSNVLTEPPNEKTTAAIVVDVMLQRSLQSDEAFQIE
ncbi:hypothetical protein N7508_003239 [Penicillium antarcticum]|uniref:uncharacterized protein n=1 Tax=Penicillium antarcticum TaxID=416450 RepID=UPI0023851603|nr:uncharacterized protein N7508_003239 [Penicillium antarcticum]KAJ5312409.1 hypothetical protein N7508_003239 [Penicillium antarcticum]